MRDVIVVDVETTSLNNPKVLEVAAVNLTTGLELSFVPHFDMKDLQYASPKAMQVNRYFERGIWEQMLSPDATRQEYGRLATWLSDATMAGSNPRFDYGALPKWVVSKTHHRLLDLAPYAAGKLNLPLGEIPGLEAVCQTLGVVNEDPHSALGDARATAACFTLLEAL